MSCSYIAAGLTFSLSNTTVERENEQAGGRGRKGGRHTERNVAAPCFMPSMNWTVTNIHQTLAIKI